MNAHRRFLLFYSSILLTTTLQGQVTLVNSSYSSGIYTNPILTHINGAGNDRLLLFIAANEYDIATNMQIASIDYGGQTMTLAGSEEIYTASGNCWNEIEVYYLLESSILAAASNSFTVTYSSTTNLRAIKHTAITFADVNQTTPFGQVISASNTNTFSIQSPPLSGNPNDMLISILSGGQGGTYSMPGFNIIDNKNENTHTYASFNRLLSCDPVTPSASINYFSMNRQVLLSMVIQSNQPPPTPISLVANSSNNTSGCTTPNGTATVTASGGTQPYSYLWSTSPAQTTQTATGLLTGSYTVTVTDSIGCKQLNTFTISGPASPSVTVSSNNPSCNGGNDGSATAVATGGIFPYSYSWSQSGGSSASVTGLSAGTYTVMVSDGNGCTGTQTVTVTSPSAVVLSTSSTNNTSCIAPNGTATANAGGGTPGYNYSWSVSPVQMTQTATGLSNGTYTVIVTDANGCSQAQSLVINNPAFPNATTSSINVLCNGGSDGVVSVFAMGGTFPYSYSWAPVGGTTSSVSGLSVGIYTVTVTDANSCTSVKTVMITEPLLLSVLTTAIEADCNQNTGIAVATVTGGTGAYTYLWTDGQINQAATGLGAGSYTVLVTDANGCIDSNAVTVGELPCPCSDDVNVAIPNAFSPNNDGENDFFQIFYRDLNCIKEFHWVIFDRWGEKIFITRSPQKTWDGTYKGKPMDTGVYVYYLNATLMSGKEIAKHGNVSLIK